MDTHVRLVAVPPSQWKIEPLASLVGDIMLCERRIAKGSNLDVERRRYTLACQHVESWALRWLAASGSGRSVVLGPRYVDVLAILASLAENAGEEAGELARESRAGSTVFPPDSLPLHASLFDRFCRLAGLEEDEAVLNRLAFLRTALSLEEEGQRGFGLVEVQIPYLRGSPPPAPTTADARETQQTAPGEVQRRPNGLCLPDHEGADLRETLRYQLIRGISEGTAVNFSNPTHIVISEVLREFVYGHHTGGEEALVRVVYGDGSEGKPFPLGGLHERPDEELRPLLALPPLRCALLSMRHLDMDSLVDMAWFLNQQASRPRGAAATDAFCYEQTLKQLTELEVPVRVDVYQTGLQPAVVGFYRALVELLKRDEGRPARMVVVPQYLRTSGEYTAGRPWY